MVEFMCLDYILVPLRGESGIQADKWKLYENEI